jgi:hypothetical protein
MGRREPGWSGSRVPGRTGSVDRESKSSPAISAAQPAAALPNQADARRRVGGYAVPMDNWIPVSGADAVPIRLRRQAAGGRYARAASSPSS